MKSVLVYSAGQGAICHGCGKPVGTCSCPTDTSTPRGDGVVRVSRETKGRKGKGVTLIAGIPLDEDALAALAQDLKKRCGTGGTVKGGVIEIQGDHRDRLLEDLRHRGFRVKQAGG